LLELVGRGTPNYRWGLSKKAIWSSPDLPVKDEFSQVREQGEVFERLIIQV
jgi:hypothetical protein